MTEITDTELAALPAQLAHIARRILAGASQSMVAAELAVSQPHISVKVAQIESALGKALPRAPKTRKAPADGFDGEQVYASRVARQPRCPRCSLRGHTTCDISIDSFASARRSE